MYSTTCMVVAEYLALAPSSGQELELQIMNDGRQALSSVPFVAITIPKVIRF